MDRLVDAQKLSFVVAGCGSIGKRHIKNLLALGAGDVVACDLRADRRAEIRDRLGINALESLNDGLLKRPNAVLVASPTALHISMALNAAERGVHVFVEKPLAHSWDGVEKLIEIVRQNRLISLVGCNMRFHPGLLVVKHLLEQKAVGPVIAAHVEVGQYLPDWHPWEDYRDTYSARTDLGGGVILDAIHEIDYIRWLLGEVKGVFCLADKLSHLEIDTEDNAALLLRFENGAIGEIHLDYVQRTYSRSCRIIGEEGTIHWDYVAGQVRWYCAARKDWQVFENPPNWQANDMYLDEMRHFIDCLTRRAAPEQDFTEGARILSVALAAKASARNLRWMELGRLS